jgi:hypothetical protein
LAIVLVAAPAADVGWITLFAGTDLAAWKDSSGWQLAKAVTIDPVNARRFVAEPGEGLLVSHGKGKDLLSKQSFGDVDVHVEFFVSKGSNSGVKLMGLYEIQIIDRPPVPAEKLTGDFTGGIYPRAVQAPSYRHLDRGFPPLVDAARPAGQWQTLAITFTAPRFTDGKKTRNAAFAEVRLNGTVVQSGRDVGSPTGHNHVRKEVATGPLLLQGDHGPVAFRNVRVRPRAAD